MSITDSQIERLVQIVLQHTHTDLTGYRPETLARRITVRLDLLDMDADRYLSACDDNPRECEELVNTVAINVSSFFRNPIVFETIAESILPGLMRRKEELRVWSAGCAAGEEAYSVAILIKEALGKPNGAEAQPVIFATDIDSGVLKRAKTAFYPRESLKDTKLGLVDAYFSPRKDGFELAAAVKKMVHFSTHDLLSNRSAAPPESIYGSFDVVLCRNVLIYFSDSHQAQILEKLRQSLAPEGYLVLGDSEAMRPAQANSRFRIVDSKHRIYQR
jgi:chemotaxis protein methyltransferase CheR